MTNITENPLCHHLHAPNDEDGVMVIGNGVRPVGRWVRLFFAIAWTSYFFLRPLYFDPSAKEQFVAILPDIALYLGIIIASYIVVFKLLGEFFFRHLNPWMGTLVFLGIPTLLSLFSLVPFEFQMAFGLYVSLSLALTFFLKYGGCEVVALPTILTGNRYTMYCPFNAMDIVERAATPTDDEAHSTNAVVRIGGMVAAIVTGVVFSYFYAFQQNGLLVAMEVLPEIDSQWSILLALPLAYFLVRFLKGQTKDEGFFNLDTRRFGLGALLLTAALAVWYFELVGSRQIWLSAMVFGLFVVLWDIVSRFLLKKNLSEAISVQSEDR